MMPRFGGSPGRGLHRPEGERLIYNIIY